MPDESFVASLLPAGWELEIFYGNCNSWVPSLKPYYRLLYAIDMFSCNIVAQVRDGV